MAEVKAREVHRCQMRRSLHIRRNITLIFVLETMGSSQKDRVGNISFRVDKNGVAVIYNRNFDLYCRHWEFGKTLTNIERILQSLDSIYHMYLIQERRAYGKCWNEGTKNQESKEKADKEEGQISESDTQTGHCLVSSKTDNWMPYLVWLSG